MITNIRECKPFIQEFEAEFKGELIVRKERWNPNKKTPDLLYIGYLLGTTSKKEYEELKRAIRKARKPHWHNPYNAGR